MNNFSAELQLVMKSAAVLLAGFVVFISSMFLIQLSDISSSYDNFDDAFVYFGLVCLGVGVTYFLWLIGREKKEPYLKRGNPVKSVLGSITMIAFGVIGIAAEAIYLSEILSIFPDMQNMGCSYSLNDSIRCGFITAICLAIALAATNVLFLSLVFGGWMICNDNLKENGKC